MKNKIFSLVVITCLILSSNNLARATFGNVEKDRGIVAGYPDGSFGPLNSINRAEFLTILMHNLPDVISEAPASGCGFSDVKSSDWFAKPICFAKSNGYAKGYRDGTFGPEKPVSLVEALALTERIFGFQITEDKEVWYRPFVTRAGDRKLIPISIESFEQKLTRQEMADMIVRFIKDKEGGLEDYLKISKGDGTTIDYSCLYNKSCFVGI